MKRLSLKVLSSQALEVFQQELNELLPRDLTGERRGSHAFWMPRVTHSLAGLFFLQLCDVYIFDGLRIISLLFYFH